MFCLLLLLCLLVSLGSRVGPNIFGLIFMESVVLSICSASCVLYSAWSGVKKVYVVLCGLIMRLFVYVHVGMTECLFLLCLYGCVLMLW